LEKSEVLLVLEAFKGLFRKSSEPDKEEHFYTLQLRYARRWLGESDDESDDQSTSIGEAEPRGPLEAEYLSALLGFISHMVEQEQASKRQSRANWAAFVAAFVAAIAATVGAIISYTSSIARP
jgi:hypothetical protein